MSSIDIKDFSNDKITRGIWHSWHLIGFNAKNKSDVTVLYAFILMYVTNMVCKKCHEHSILYIKNTSHITDVLNDYNLTDSEIIEEFNIWLYDFHKCANIHAGKTSPSIEEVIHFYLTLEVCEESCGN